MILQNMNALIFGGGGSIGGAAARAFAREGANVFLSGPRMASLRPVMDEITAAGGNAEAEEVDALDLDEVDHYVHAVSGRAGTVDIAFNAVGLRDTQDIPLVKMAMDDFLRPLNIAMRTQFITATAAGRTMMKQGSGVILSITATPGGIGYPLVGGFGPACCAIEGFSRDLASELGPHGVRVVNIRSAGSPDSRPFTDAAEQAPETMSSVIRKLEDDTMLKQLPLMADIANVAVFLASGMAGKITGVTVDVTCGTTGGLNYRTMGVPFPDRSGR